MPLTRSQLLKILADNRKELLDAEAEVVAAYEGSSVIVEAEVVRYLAILRQNVERIERMLGESDATSGASDRE